MGKKERGEEKTGAKGKDKPLNRKDAPESEHFGDFFDAYLSKIEPLPEPKKKPDGETKDLRSSIRQRFHEHMEESKRILRLEQRELSRKQANYQEHKKLNQDPEPLSPFEETARSTQNKGKAFLPKRTTGRMREELPEILKDLFNAKIADEEESLPKPRMKKRSSQKRFLELLKHRQNDFQRGTRDPLKEFHPLIRHTKFYTSFTEWYKFVYLANSKSTEIAIQSSAQGRPSEKD